MTVKELLAFFENYYGEKYTGMFLDVMTEYLDSYSEEFLSAIAKVMVSRFSRIYNKAPCPADINKNMDEINHFYYKTMQAARLERLLSEPQEEKATPEEAEMYLEQIKVMMKMGAMAKSLNNFINQLEGRNK